MVHATLARIAPEFAIDAQEAMALAKAIANYARHSGYTLDPRTRDLIALIGTICMIEGTRVIRVTTRRQSQRAQARAMAEAEKRQPTGGTVVEIGGAGRTPWQQP